MDPIDGEGQPTSVDVTVDSHEGADVVAIRCDRRTANYLAWHLHSGQPGQASLVRLRDLLDLHLTGDPASRKRRLS